jgi:predicted amino acid dehydrogenase
MTASVQDKHSDFAIIAHQANWKDIASVVAGIRDKELDPVPQEDLKYLFPAFPSRSIFNIEAVSSFDQKIIKGKYIETFISPDKISGKAFLKENIDKINKAALVAIRNNTAITTLGGFTSIVLEGNLALLPPSATSKFTTGNTLTAAFIAQGILRACKMLSLELDKCSMLILGATGDLGTACTRYFSSKVKTLNLTGLNLKRLEALRDEIPECECNISLSGEDFFSGSDIVISVTSSSGMPVAGFKKNSLVVDAGYPKNLSVNDLQDNVRLFYGGMGYVSGGYSFSPDFHQQVYSPFPGIGHGCILESLVLAFENRAEEYSSGKGKISVQKMDEILALAEKHGIVLAPFYNDKGIWPENNFNR